MGTNTGIGIGIGIPFKNNALGGDKPYFPPELKARMIGVWTNYGKKNTDADRNIIKNKIPNAGGDLEILNAAYEGMSGCNGYPVIFGINKTWKNVPTYNSIYNINDNKIHFTKILFTNRGLIFSFVKQNNQLYDITEIPSFKIRVSGLKGDSKLRYSYIKTENAVYQSLLDLDNGIHKLPKSLAPTDSISNDSWIGFTVTPRIENETSFDCDITIEILPEYEGAFVTDGVDDMIISQKTLQEMGVTKELTIVSMIHQISFRNSASVPLTNYIRPTDNIYARNQIADIGKTGIYGYVVYNIKNSTVENSHIVNTILGDKNDYSIYTIGDLSQGKFSVQGYIDGNGNIHETSSVAHYWTFAVLGKATEDEINFIIGNYNLDRSLKPDILCNIGKQGITNDNHADFNDKLVDYSGNGRDVQMNNLAWKGGSGVAAKPYETFKDWTSESSSTSIITQIDEFTRIVESTTNGYWVSRIRRNSDLDKVYDAINVYLYQDNNFLVHECKYEVDGIKHSIPINESVGKGYHKLEMYTKDRYTELPENAENIVLSEWYFPKSTKGSIKYSVIPSYKGGILLDGINDFGKVTRMPIYKDYTFIIDREIISIGNTAGIVASKSEDSTDVNKQGAFLFEYLGAPNNISAWSFYKDNGKVANTDFTRGISYQSKYSYNGIELLAGTALDSDKLWLGILRDRDSRFANVAIYSLMSFPYSMSKFLIERQLKKHKLGTLYPDMVEFRPIVKKSNVKYNIIEIWQQGGESLYRPASNYDKTGIYLKKDSIIGIYVKTKDADEVTKIVVNGTEYTDLKINWNGFYYVTLPITKSPQKIDITIDEYIRYEDIVQPYPSIINLVSIDKTYFYTYGDKLKVGDVILYNSYKNLLKGLYSLNGQLKYNGVYIYDIDGRITVAKEMVFSWTVSPTYLLDNNEPKCILSPRLLRIPNSSYKILGHIPDISGHGNHGKINNSAYAEGSGVNEDGSYQFDGVNDFVTIPTVNGGKQVFMKVNVMTTIDKILYDQRNSEEGGYFSDNFAIMTSNSDSILAYAGRNPDGKTYIDGILNTNITCGQLLNITHNITALVDDNKPLGKGGVIIGASKTPASYCKAAVYDFMLFDEISTDDKIQELNEYVGIEAKVELPPYYWDAYGKTNSDADKDTIQQRGIAVGDYDLINYNHAYEGMSGYNGYPVVFGAGKTLEVVASEYGYISDVTSTTIHITMVKNAGTGLLFSYVKKDGALTNIKEIPAFRVTVKGLEGNSKFGYRYLATEDATGETLVYLGNGTHELAKSFAPTEALLDLTRNAWVGMFITPMVEGEVVFDCDITIEVLPEYENGLVYDGVEDFSDNKNVPIIDDFTVIAKRTWLEENISDKPFIIKGDTLYPDGNQNAFLFEYGKLSTYSFGQNNKYDESVVPSLISWATPTSYNGTTSLVRGSAIDTVGIDIAHATKMVLYKLILYPKTISLLEINFLKNLMEKDEIIDLNNKIFIQE